MPQVLDVIAVRAWCSLALEALGRDRAEIDAINVYPVADGDTGTNLYLTVESAHQAVEAVFAGLEAGPEPAAPALPEVMRAMAHGALIGARGNSGTILAQLLRGMAQVLTEGGTGEGDHAAGADADALRLALGRAAESAREAVAHPVEGTVLTVATAAAEAASGVDGDCRDVVRAAYEGACAALDATPGQLAALGSAGVVDAGGRGLVVVLGALSEAVSGEAAPVRRGGGAVHARVDAVPDGVLLECPEDEGAAGPAFEVIYLLEADDGAVARLRSRLDALGDSLVVVGGDGLWNVHVHVDDAGAAVEAGVEAGRPYRIRITHFGLGDVHATHASAPRERAERAVVAVVPGDGLAGLYREAGATTVPDRPGDRPPAGSSSTRYGGPTRARWCCCRTTPSCGTPPRRRPSRPVPRASGSRSSRPARRSRASQRSPSTSPTGASTRTSWR